MSGTDYTQTPNLRLISTLCERNVLSSSMRSVVPWQDRVIPEPNSGCLLWEGAIAGYGYGIIVRSGKNVYVHRMVWEESNGSIPDGMRVLHRCDVPACVNIDHLFLGTSLDNMQDMTAKGRGSGGGFFSAAKTECKWGHPFTEANTLLTSDGRKCRACDKRRAREYRARKRAVS